MKCELCMYKCRSGKIIDGASVVVEIHSLNRTLGRADQQNKKATPIVELAARAAFTSQSGTTTMDGICDVSGYTVNLTATKQ